MSSGADSADRPKSDIIAATSELSNRSPPTSSSDDEEESLLGEHQFSLSLWQ
jgi:hypothetical protein